MSVPSFSIGEYPGKKGDDDELQSFASEWNRYQIQEFKDLQYVKEHYWREAQGNRFIFKMSYNHFLEWRMWHNTLVGHKPWQLAHHLQDHFVLNPIYKDKFYRSEKYNGLQRKHMNPFDGDTEIEYKYSTLSSDSGRT